MESFRGLSDEELLEKLQSRRGPLGPPRKLYEKKFYEFETRRWRRGGADDLDNDRTPPEFGEGARPRQAIGERPSSTLRDHSDSPLRLEPRQPLRAPPGPLWSPPGPPEPPPDTPGRLIPLRPQLVALGLIGGVLLVLLLLGGGPG